MVRYCVFSAALNNVFRKMGLNYNLIYRLISFQHLALSDVVMISATAPISAVFFARIFIKEPIVIADIANMVTVIIGIIMIVKPPFVFGVTSMYIDDPEAIYAVILMIFGSMLLQANIYVLMRMLKGTYFRDIYIQIHFSTSISVFNRYSLVSKLFCFGHHWIYSDSFVSYSHNGLFLPTRVRP